MMSEMSVRELSLVSGVAFGTSGARGLVSAMTDEVCHGYTTGFLFHLKSSGQWKPGGKVVLGGDLRPSTPRILAACSMAIRDLGGEPEFGGLVPTPALAFYAMSEGIPAIMVTGSHIPDDRNGIKFYRPDGEILKNDEAMILSQQIGCRARNDADANGEVIVHRAVPDIGAQYASRYTHFFGTDFLGGMRVGVYQHSAVGRDLLANILATMGAEVIILGRSERFVPVDTEAVRPEDVALAREWATEHRLDAIVSTDGDGDRPLLADEHGEWLRGDVLAMLCARELQMQTVVTPVSSNTIVESCGIFTRVERTRIGSPYVVAAMQSALAAGEQMVCGYEANGGFLLGSDLRNGQAALSALPTRDAVLPIIAVLAAGRHSGVSGLIRDLPSRITFSARIADFSPQRSAALWKWLTGGASLAKRVKDLFGDLPGAEMHDVDYTDGMRLTFANGRIIHLRQSGNAPELRCYSEAEDPSTARALGRDVLALVAQRF